MSKPVKVKIADIDLDSKTQCRVATCDDAIDAYAEALEAGNVLPPVTLFCSGKKYFIGDGWQRVRAHQQAGRDHIFAEVADGTLRDAIFYATGANKEHGVRRTKSDIRQAIDVLLKDEEWSKFSDHMIAAQVGCDHKTVAKYRDQLGNSPTDNTRTGKDGKKYQASKKAAVKAPKDDPEPEEKAEEEIEEEETGLNIEDLAESYQGPMNALSRVKKEVKALSDDPKFGVYLRDKITRITTDLDSVRGAIRQAEPMQLCSSCSGDGCKTCRQSGFLTRIYVESRSK